MADLVTLQNTMNKEFDTDPRRAGETMKMVKNMYESVPAMRQEIMDYTEADLKILQEQMVSLHKTAYRVPNENITLGMLEEVVQWKKRDAGPVLGSVEQSGQHASMIGGGFAAGTLANTLLPAGTIAAAVGGTLAVAGGGLGTMAINTYLDRKFADSPKTRVALKTLINGGILVAGGLATGLWAPIAGAVGLGLLTSYAYRSLARNMSEPAPQAAQERSPQAVPQPLRS